MSRNLLVAVALIAFPGSALAEGCFGGYGHAIKDTVAEAQPAQTPIPGDATILDDQTTLVASLTDCSTLAGDALVACLAAQPTE